MNLLFYIVVFALFMLMTGFRLFAEGMFVDGVTYAAVSRNLADGIGSFWEPHFTATLYPQFHEHPPLAFGMEGLAFRVFGDHLLVERFYSLAAMLVTGYLIVLIWKELTGEKKSGWIPLFFWVLFPLVSWAAASNLLDNTLGIFTTAAILFILKSGSRNRYFYLALAGFAIFSGLLTKGPFALFPWVLPIFMLFTQPVPKIQKALVNTLVLIAATLIPLILLVTLSTAARESLLAYWQNQVIGSLEGVKTVASRFYILGILGSQLILPVLAAGIIALIFKSNLNRENIRNIRRPAMMLLITGLSGVLPIMISMKQSSFYLLAALPLFALMISLPVWALLQHKLTALSGAHPVPKLFRFAVWILLAVSLVLPPVFAKHSLRDRDKLAMIHDFSTEIPSGTTIRITPSLFTDWSLQSYFARHSMISLDPSANPASTYYLSGSSDQPNDTIATRWIRIREKNGFILFKK